MGITCWYARDELMNELISVVGKVCFDKILQNQGITKAKKNYNRC